MKFLFSCLIPTTLFTLIYFILNLSIDLVGFGMGGLLIKLGVSFVCLFAYGSILTKAGSEKDSYTKTLIELNNISDYRLKGNLLNLNILYSSALRRWVRLSGESFEDTITTRLNFLISGNVLGLISILSLVFTVIVLVMPFFVIPMWAILSMWVVLLVIKSYFLLCEYRLSKVELEGSSGEVSLSNMQLIWKDLIEFEELPEREISEEKDGESTNVQRESEGGTE